MEGPRSVREEELESAVRLADAIFRCGEKHRSMEEDYPILFSEDNLKNLRVYVDNNKIVSLLSALFGDMFIFNYRITVIRLGMICTDPEYRGRGLATSLLADTEKVAVHKGAMVAVISGDRGLYSRFGAVKAGVFVKYKLEARMLAGFHTARMRPVTSDDLPMLAQAHAEKRVRFERTDDDFGRILTASMALDRPAQIFMHEESSSRNSAYIVVIRDDEGILNCVEYAGDTGCVVGMLRSLSEREGGPVLVHTIGADRIMNRFLSQVSAPAANEVPRTWKILSPASLVDALHRCCTERHAQSEVSRLQESIGKIDGPELTRMVFGVTELPIVTAEQRQGGVFPIPLPDYGMDYL